MGDVICMKTYLFTSPTIAQRFVSNKSQITIDMLWYFSSNVPNETNNAKQIIADDLEMILPEKEN